MSLETEVSPKLSLSQTQIADLKLASSCMTGSVRRGFQAQMSSKYCEGNARRTERVFGWGRETVQVGLHEQRTGITCLGAQTGHCGPSFWEEQHPQIAKILWELADEYSQQDPTFRTTQKYTRLTAAEALAQLRVRGIEEECLPSPSTMAAVLNRNGYRLRRVLKAKPQKKFPKQTRSLSTSTKKTSRLKPMTRSSE